MPQQQGAIGIIITWVFSNFSLAMFILAIVFVLLHKLMSSYLPKGEILFRWVSFFALGLAGIYGFIMHGFFANIAAQNIGWDPSPFQYEVAMANLAIGVLGILAFSASYGFRLATVIASICWLWGDAIGHIMRIVQLHDFSAGNAGSWLWMDILVPLVLIIALRKLKKSEFR